MKEKTKKYFKILGVLFVVFGCVFSLTPNTKENDAIRVNADVLNESETTMTIDINNDNNITFLDKDIMLRADIDVLGVGNNFRYEYDFSELTKHDFGVFLLNLTDDYSYKYSILNENELGENFSILYDGNRYDFSFIVSNGPNDLTLRTFYFLTKNQFYSNSYNMVDFDGLSINLSSLDITSVYFELYYYCDYWTYTTAPRYLNSINVDFFSSSMVDFAYYIPPYLTLNTNEAFVFYMELNNMNGNIIQGAIKTNEGFNFIGDIFYNLQNQGLNTKGDKYIVEVVGINNTTSIGNTLFSYVPVYSYDETLFYVDYLTYNSLLFLHKYCVPSWVAEYQSEMYFNERKLYRFGTQYPVFRGDHADNPWVGTALDYLHDNVYGTFNNFTFEYGGKYYDNIYILAPVSWSYKNGNQYEWYIRAGNQFIQNEDIIVTMKMVEDSFEITGEYDYLSGQSLTYKGAYTEQIYNFMVLFGFVDNNIGPSIGIGNTVGTFTDIFDIFGSAFNGVYSAFSVYVLPGVTLWALCMIPLVAVIILFIVKLFKR